MLAGNAVKTWTFDFMAYLWAIHACNDCTTHGNKLFKVRNVTRLDLETSNVLAIALYPYRIHLTEYFPKNVQLIKIRIFCKNDLLLEKNRLVNSFRIYNWAAHVLRRENKFNIMNHVEYNGPHRAFRWAILGGVSIFLQRHCNRFSR